jgi:dipeptidyl aminopeptidase/acylaminoacyl peptidase
MKKVLDLVKGALGLAAFVLVLVVLFGPLSQRAPVGQEEQPVGTATATASLPLATATPEPYPLPPVPLPDTPTPGPYPPPRTPTPVLFEPTLTPRPIPTEPPVPTPLPTPVITPIPLASPPFIPGIEDKLIEPYKIVLRKDNVVWIMNNDGSDKRMLIDTESRASLFLGCSPHVERIIRWGRPSPDGKKLALVLCDVWKREYPWQPMHFSIHILEIDTGEFDFLVEGVEPVWSPDGQWIAYQGPDSGLWVVDVTTGEAEEVFSVEKGCYEATDFAWSPDGKRIAFLKRETGLGGIPEMLAVNADGSGEAAQLIPRTGWSFGGLRWSPDRKIYYSSGAGEYTGPEIAGNLWAMDADGSHQIQLTKDISILSADLSPDGDWVAFSGTRHYEEPGYPYDLWLISSNGGGLQRLTKDPISDDHHPRWSPDGTQIVFERGDENGIWTINLSDGSLKRVYPDNVDFAIVR